MIRVIRNNVYISTEGQNYIIRSTLKQLIQQYDLNHHYIRINKSEMINPKYIQKINKTSFQLYDGKLVYISRHYLSCAKQFYSEIESAHVIFSSGK
ncbi:MAG: LytTR family transcriptional regulator [Solobacterium sp.]|nr:LytTR family transcriptional regulator [Solobacterium sp.]